MPKLLLLAVLAVLLGPARAPAGEPAGAGGVAKAQGRLAAGLLAEIRSHEAAPNVLVSPATLAAALGGIALGASQSGRAAIAEGLGVGALEEGPGAAVAAIRQAAGSPGAPMTVALRIVFDDALALLPEAGAMLDRQGIDHATADLDGAYAVGEINGWVSEKTKGAIPSILDSPPGGGFVSLGALHFKALWKAPFEPRSPAAPFRRADGSTIQVPTMHLALSAQRFRKDARFAAVDLAYTDENYRMILVVAREAGGIGAADLPAIAPWLAGEGFGEAKGEVFLPRFALKDGRDVVGALAGVGLPPERLKLTAFPGFTRERVHIERILQKTAIEVDETGTEAAAATAVIAERSIDTGFVGVVADAPFAFALRDRRTGLILAAGLVGDPSSAGK